MIPTAITGVANGRPELRPRPYRWRDPQRVSPERLAELAAHDAWIASLGLTGDPARDTRTAINSLPRDQRPAASAAITAVYIAARERRLTIRDAAAHAGVSYRHGQKIEAARRDAARAAIPAGCTCRWHWDGCDSSWKRRPYDACTAVHDQQKAENAQ